LSKKLDSVLQPSYLRALAALENLESPVKTSSLAQTLGLPLIKVGKTLHQLAKLGLLKYKPYEGATLTEEGRRVFSKSLRIHGLWEIFLLKHLAINWEDVYHCATNLESSTPDIVIEKLDDFLEHPLKCPHGMPIPDKDLNIPTISDIPLPEINIGQTSKVSRVIHMGKQELLTYLNKHGIIPGAKIKILDISTFDSSLTIQINDSPIISMNSQTASSILMEKRIE
jgi:DtxR family transcriptional regulator, Mn-dependent transcriptional regulator